MQLEGFDYCGRWALAYARFDFENVNGRKLIKINFSGETRAEKFGELNVYTHVEFLSAGSCATCAKCVVSLRMYDG